MKLSLRPRAHALGLLLATLTGCAGPALSTTSPPQPRPPVTAESRARFDDALAAFVRHDEANDWRPDTCAAVASMFEAAAPHGSFPEARFNAAMALQRCGEHAKARARFEAIVKEHPSFHAARAKLALYRYKDDGDADGAIDLLDQVVMDGRFEDVGALVDLAAMQMARHSDERGLGCKDDMDCAKLNLQRALAVDDTYMPAHNQLALFHLQRARERAGRSFERGHLGREVLTPASARKRPDVQQLELAALVCSQAIAKQPRYAPIHNTAGLVQNELGNVNGAVAEFARATELDPKLFEAEMNLAAVNLGFRGFDQARAAYQRALAVRPDDYDAHLGLAVALRGPIVDDGDEGALRAKVAAVRAEIDAAKRIDPQRPDAWFNEAVLIHELESRRGSTAESIAALDRAAARFETFIARSGGKPAYAPAVARARERLADIAQTKAFLAGSAPPPQPPPAATRTRP